MNSSYNKFAPTTFACSPTNVNQVPSPPPLEWFWGELVKVRPNSFTSEGELAEVIGGKWLVHTGEPPCDVLSLWLRQANFPTQWDNSQPQSISLVEWKNNLNGWERKKDNKDGTRWRTLTRMRNDQLVKCK